MAKGGVCASPVILKFDQLREKSAVIDLKSSPSEDVFATLGVAVSPQHHWGCLGSDCILAKSSQFEKHVVSLPHSPEYVLKIRFHHCRETILYAVAGSYQPLP